MLTGWGTIGYLEDHLESKGACNAEEFCLESGSKSASNEGKPSQ